MDSEARRELATQHCQQDLHWMWEFNRERLPTATPTVYTIITTNTSRPNFDRRERTGTGTMNTRIHPHLALIGTDRATIRHDSPLESSSKQFLHI